ncbi:hypothetical protein MGWOODY_Mmi1980 [hydrothermal vent metagenome]|uniref:Uncharacterized protein n=1 Tax=hydrothermal vent metagenome TaxID=652676 RepID=A0A160VHS4_9ZZZZ
MSCLFHSLSNSFPRKLREKSGANSDVSNRTVSASNHIYFITDLG